MILQVCTLPRPIQALHLIHFLHIRCVQFFHIQGNPIASFFTQRWCHVFQMHMIYEQLGMCHYCSKCAIDRFPLVKDRESSLPRKTLCLFLSQKYSPCRITLSINVVVENHGKKVVVLHRRR